MDVLRACPIILISTAVAVPTVSILEVVYGETYGVEPVGVLNSWVVFG